MVTAYPDLTISWVWPFEDPFRFSIQVSENGVEDWEVHEEVFGDVRSFGPFEFWTYVRIGASDDEGGLIGDWSNVVHVWPN